MPEKLIYRFLMENERGEVMARLSFRCEEKLIADGKLHPQLRRFLKIGQRQIESTDLKIWGDS